MTLSFCRLCDKYARIRANQASSLDSICVDACLAVFTRKNWHPIDQQKVLTATRHVEQENVREPTVSDSSPSGPGTNPVHYPWGSVSSLLMNSKGEEIVYPVEDDRDRIWARRLEWVAPGQGRGRTETASKRL